MGIFRPDSEEEKLLKAIKNSSMSYSFKESMIRYIESIINGSHTNDFYDVDFLVRVMLSLTDLDDLDFDDVIEKLVRQVKILMPNGDKTDNYEVLKERFINQYCGIDGYINLGIMNHPSFGSFYNLFASEDTFFSVLNSIKDANSQNGSVIDEIDHVIEFGIKVSPYCMNDDELKHEILSFLTSVTTELIDEDIDEYLKKRVMLAEEKSGVYERIDEGTLALISAEVEKLEGYVLKLRNLERRISDYDNRIKKITSSGVSSIKEAEARAKEELAAMPDVARKELQGEVERINKQLDEYLLELEDRLKKSSDEVFNKLLESASAKIRELKTTVQLITQTTDTDLARIQKKTQEGIDSLIKMTESNPKLQMALETVESHESLKKGLEALASMGGVPSVGIESPQKVIVPSFEREILPANETIVLPSNVNIIIPAFDRKVNIKERRKVILEELERRKASGEIFHSKTEQIITCMLEGDWPYLYGPSGCGKTHTVEQVASLLGTEIIENGRITEDFTILGYYDPQGKFRATETFVALAYGKLLFIDEMDTGVPETQTIFNRIYSKLLATIEHPDRKYYVTFASDRPTLVNPNFRMISAGNTKGGGENSQFNARLQIDESVQQRMTPIEFNYDNNVEKLIFGEYTSWYNFFVQFRKACDEYALKNGFAVAPGITTTRDASAIKRYLDDDSKDIDTILLEKFIQTKDSTYLHHLSSYFKHHYNLSEDEYRVKNVSAAKVEEKVLVKKFVSDCNKAS